MTSRFKTYIQLIAAVLWIVPILSACGGAGASGGAGAGGYSRQAVSVKISTAHSGVITESTIYTGTAKSRHSVTLTPQIDGQVTKILVEAGDTVKKGTPLIEISPEKQQASVSSYEAASN
ncbi:MAG TPA: biotin/lipoyl-binding protein, partial [Trichormus sp.]